MRKPDWIAVDCRTCEGSLVAVPDPSVPAAKNAHDHLSWVHHDGFDPDTLAVLQRDAGHVPIVRKTPGYVP